MPPRPRVDRERVELLREREPVLRLAAPVERFAVADLGVERFAVEAVEVERLAVERFAGDLRAVDVRLAPALADFARVERFAAGRFAGDLRAVVLRAVDFRLAVDFRAGFDSLLELLEAVVPLSIDHLPDITRCAASATASAIIEPSFVALETTLLAARSAVSAASSPASRIFLRAAGLALIAAAAAARPAASISLLIAALASLSTVALFEPERDEDERVRDVDDLGREELVRADLAIAFSPSCGKDTLMPFRFPNEVGSASAQIGKYRKM